MTGISPLHDGKPQVALNKNAASVSAPNVDLPWIRVVLQVAIVMKVWTSRRRSSWRIWWDVWSLPSQGKTGGWLGWARPPRPEKYDDRLRQLRDDEWRHFQDFHGNWCQIDVPTIHHQPDRHRSAHWWMTCLWKKTSGWIFSIAIIGFLENSGWQKRRTTRLRGNVRGPHANKYVDNEYEPWISHHYNIKPSSSASSNLAI